jgi:hypothetical protein
MELYKSLLIDSNAEMPTRAKQVITEAKLGWVAGFIDGEGYIGIIRQKWNNTKVDRWYYRPAIDVAQSKPEPILLLKEMFNAGRIVKQTAWNGSHIWHWVVTGPVQINEILTQLLPYLIVKKQQAELVIKFRTTVIPRGCTGRFSHLPDSVYAEREAIWAAVKALNSVKAVQAERLNKETSLAAMEDAIVRSHGNENHESTTEMIVPPSIN